MKKILMLILGLTFYAINAQEEVPHDTLFKPDPYYLEDQLYFGISYIILKNLPNNVTQNGFSNQIKFGYIRDIPINKKRNVGFGVGLGYSNDTYFHNLRISKDETNGELIYQNLDGETYNTNSFTVNKIDFPFEFRLRGSAPEKFKFWRVYTGITASYALNSKSEYTSQNIDIVYKKLNIENKWTYGINVSVGYGLWNFNFYYGLSNLIKKDIIVYDTPLNMKNMNLGVVYYFL